ETGRKVTIGIPYEMAYVDDEPHAPLPFRPKLLTIAADRQQSCFKYLVYAWRGDGQAFLIDCGAVGDRDSFLDLRNRPYYVEGFEDPIYIYSGLVDCGYEHMEIYRLCQDAQDIGWELHPSRGWGWKSDFRAKTI